MVPGDSVVGRVFSAGFINLSKFMETWRQSFVCLDFKLFYNGHQQAR